MNDFRAWWGDAGSGDGQRGGLGTVMADRPKSVLAHAETYGMELIRYVHNNPVRAGVVQRASESSWSSHRAYLGLVEVPPWLSVEAVLGLEGSARERVRAELAEYVDEGRDEPRRPEFSGEVSRELARRVRRLMGGEVELSYPVLGPDTFVKEALREQVGWQRHGRRMVPAELGIEEVAQRVFAALGVDSGLVRTRTRRRDVARARSLVTWLWVEWLGRPQVEVAEGFGVRGSRVCAIMAKLRRQGITDSDEELLRGVLDRLLEVAARDQGSEEEESKGEYGGDMGPKVLVPCPPSNYG